MQEGTAAQHDQEKIREPAETAKCHSHHLSVWVRRDTDQCGKIERQADRAVDYTRHRRPAPRHPDRADQADREQNEKHGPDDLRRSTRRWAVSQEKGPESDQTESSQHDRKVEPMRHGGTILRAFVLSKRLGE